MMSSEVTGKLWIIGASLFVAFAGVGVTVWSPVVGLAIMCVGFVVLFGFVVWLSVGTRQAVFTIVGSILGVITGRMLGAAIFSDDGFTYFWLLPLLCLIALLFYEWRYQRKSRQMGFTRKG